MLPPAVAGIGLLVAFGRLGLLGGTFDALGIDIAFTKVAVVLAVTFVASPFYVRTAVSAFEAIDPTLPAAGADARRRARAASSSASRCRSRRGGLGAGAALAFARGIGEFGATIMFAGSLAGRHPDALARDLRAVRRRLRRRARDQRACSCSSARLTLLSVKLLTRWRSTSTSPIPFAASTPPSS